MPLTATFCRYTSLSAYSLDRLVKSSLVPISGWESAIYNKDLCLSGVKWSRHRLDKTWVPSLLFDMSFIPTQQNWIEILLPVSNPHDKRPWMIRPFWSKSGWLFLQFVTNRSRCWSSWPGLRIFWLDLDRDSMCHMGFLSCNATGSIQWAWSSSYIFFNFSLLSHGGFIVVGFWKAKCQQVYKTNEQNTVLRANFIHCASFWIDPNSST